MTDFETFWACYPKKMARLDAVRAYDKARRIASAEDILAGVQRYREHLPDEPRFIAHAATWLNAGRWDDEYDTPARGQGREPRYTDWSGECREVHGGSCEKQWTHATRMKAEGAA